MHVVAGRWGRGRRGAGGERRLLSSCSRSFAFAFPLLCLASVHPSMVTVTVTVTILLFLRVLNCKDIALRCVALRPGRTPRAESDWCSAVLDNIR